MARVEIGDSVTRVNAGVLVPGAAVNVGIYLRETTTRATYYTAATGGSSSTADIITDSLGRYGSESDANEVWIEEGSYDRWVDGVLYDRIEAAQGAGVAVMREAPPNIKYPEFAGGASGNGLDDDLPALQAFYDTYGPDEGGQGFAPNGVYRITDTIEKPSDTRGLRLVGESMYATEIRADFDNKPVIHSVGQFHQGDAVEEMCLSYAGQQDFATHPNSACIELEGVSTEPAVSEHVFRRLLFKKGTYAIHTHDLSTWNNTFEELRFAQIEHSLITIGPSGGNPVNYFKRLTSLNGGPTPTGKALNVYGEAHLEAIDIEDWTGEVFEFTGGDMSLDGLHLERWTPTDGASAFYLASGTHTLSSLNMHVISNTGIDAYLFWAQEEALVDITNHTLVMAPHDGTVTHHICGTGVSFNTTYPRVGVPDAFMWDDLNTRKATRVKPSHGGGIRTVASASVITLSDDGDVFLISGTANIDGIVGSWAEREVKLIFTGTAAGYGLAAAGNNKLAGNFTYTPDDSITLICDGNAVWREAGRSVNA